ncbi:MBL fold metallo-hydrolase [Actinomadura rubrisoli]|uniref:MBL fold metallo-hydrolase n=2 Tax=Actinomadura rubrisoli TaxID=2530368 RepID=A0A4R5BMK4_9ACTN|nr:MBL fold metallo-hydrolase [Actinomadura rubrisoli]
MTVAPEPVVERLADGVYAYVQPDGGWCLNNAGIIAAGGETALVDTAATQARALRLRDAVREITPAPPRFVVNTHFHGDHTFGNAVFTPEATVVAHEGTRADAIAAGLHLTGLWPDVEWGELTLEPPSLTYADAMTLRVGGVRAELLRLGPAHTADDTVVWLPEQRVLFAGDLVMSGVTPFCMMGSVEGSRRALARLRDLGPRTVVPGHGPVGGPELLDEADRYLAWVQRLARDGLAAGLSPLETARRADLGGHARLLDSERLAPNLRRACAEERGAPPGERMDVEELFGEMIAFNGGPPSCRA